MNLDEQPENIRAVEYVVVRMPRKLFEALQEKPENLTTLVNEPATSNDLDRLQLIYNRQTELMKLFGIHPSQVRRYPFGSLSDLMMKVLIATMREVMEIFDELPWKWWKKPKEIDWMKLRVEIIDLFHFALELCILSGMNAQDIYDVYRIKNEENLTRMNEEIGKYEE